MSRYCRSIIRLTHLRLISNCIRIYYLGDWPTRVPYIVFDVTKLTYIFDCLIIPVRVHLIIYKDNVLIIVNHLSCAVISFPYVYIETISLNFFHLLCFEVFWNSIPTKCFLIYCASPFGNVHRLSKVKVLLRASVVRRRTIVGFYFWTVLDLDDRPTAIKKFHIFSASISFMLSGRQTSFNS